LFDVDICLTTSVEGAYNDRTCFYGMEGKQYPDTPDADKAKHNMAYQYSMPDRGIGGKGFGYAGFVFLESPAVVTMTKE
jgi:hypothetical protein